MSDNTGISWTDATWNPTRGCSRVSPGCDPCYAEGVAARFSGPGLPYEGLVRRSSRGLPQWTGEVRFPPDRLDQPLRWKKPRRVFVNSMSDIFHEALSNEEIAAVFGVMAAAPQHTFQVLTKRSKRMRAWFKWVSESIQSRAAQRFLIHPSRPGHAPEIHVLMEYLARKGPGNLAFQTNVSQPWPLPNVWLGVSVESQAYAQERIPDLLACPAVVRFLSVEPLLDSVRVDDIDDGAGGVLKPLVGLHWIPRDSKGGVRSMALSGGQGPRIHWVIVGGQSGLRAKVMRVRWARSILGHCLDAGTPFFFKQYGSWAEEDDGTRVVLKHRAGADPAEWPEAWPQEFPTPVSFRRST